MKILLALTVTMLSIVLIPTRTFAAIKTQVVDYQAGDTKLKGYLAYDDSVTDKRPGVIVMPEWWGMTDYPKHRAEQLAGLGYIAFAADMFGEGKTTDDPKQAGAWAGAVKKDPQMMRARATAALDQLKKQPNVDPDKLGAIGYCFGG